MLFQNSSWIIVLIVIGIALNMFYTSFLFVNVGSRIEQMQVQMMRQHDSISNGIERLRTAQEPCPKPAPCSPETQALLAAPEPCPKLEPCISESPALLAQPADPTARRYVNDWKITAEYRGTTFWEEFEDGFVSQVRQDQHVIKAHSFLKGGYFVDLAANDAVKFSNTKALEQEYGWDGLCIEANPRYAEGLNKRRCTYVKAAVGGKTGELVKFRMEGVVGRLVTDELKSKNQSKDNTEDGEAWRILEFESVSVDKLLRDMQAPKAIDYLSLDIEGAEYEVFKKFPFNEYTFYLMTVERPKKLATVLEKNGYFCVDEMVKKTGHQGWGEMLYVHESHKHFKWVMRTMFNKTGALAGATDACPIVSLLRDRDPQDGSCNF